MEISQIQRIRKLVLAKASRVAVWEAVLMKLKDSKCAKLKTYRNFRKVDSRGRNQANSERATRFF